MPLWAGENGSLGQDIGAAPMARSNNLVYIDGRMVANLNWPIISAVYPDVSFSVTLQPNEVYSFTTTTGQGKGAAVSPPAVNLPLPYSR